MAKRFSGSTINWAALSERVPSAQRSNLTAFKTKSDGYLRRMMANPAEPPKIDWALYKKMVPVSGMVDNFEKQYTALKIPYPIDNQTKEVEAQGVELKKAVQDFIAKSNESIKNFEKEVAHIKGLLAFDQMTMEDVKDAFPDEALDPINKPSFWPHTPDAQLGYVDPDRKPSAH